MMSEQSHSAAFHARNRQSLLSGMEDNSVAVLFAAPQQIRNGDVHFPYRQDSHFAYLTGFAEPCAAAVLVKQDGVDSYQLYCQPRDEERELWDGERAGTERAVSVYGADTACDIAQFAAQIASTLKHCRRLYLSGRDEQSLNVSLSEHFGHIKNPPEIMSVDFLLDELRLIKSAEEIKWIRQATRITREGFDRILATLRPGMYEYEIEAELMRAYRSRNATWAYPHIVAGGERALVLHYNRNDQLLKDGDLLLIDSGAEYLNYASDVSRTYPVSGRYTPAQKRVYEIVLQAQRAAIDCSVPGCSWLEPHQCAVRVLIDGLRDIGIINQSTDDSIESGSYRRYFPHRTSHWLGMDVHDVGDYRVDQSWRELEAGMVFTVEPGLYLPVSTDIPEQYRGIGIRIEDDILVRARKQAQILSDGIASEPDEIEYAMRHSAGADATSAKTSATASARLTSGLTAAPG